MTIEWYLSNADLEFVPNPWQLGTKKKLELIAEIMPFFAEIMTLPIFI